MSGTAHDKPTSESSSSPAPAELTPGLQALERVEGQWRSEDERQQDVAFFQAQAAEMGIDDAQVEQLYQDMREGRILLADVLGFTSDQLAAMSYRGNELLRQGEPRRALSIYLALYELNPYEYKYQRGAAQCFQAIKEYGFALGYYRLAMATLGKEDFVCLAMIGECLFALEGKASCLKALDKALAFGTGDKQEQIYVERAQAFRKRLALNDPADKVKP